MSYRGGRGPDSVLLRGTGGKPRLGVAGDDAVDLGQRQTRAQRNFTTGVVLRRQAWRLSGQTFQLDRRLTQTRLEGECLALRLVAADFKGNVDVNTLPAGMIDHVEILTGGASSVYGADAVAGVVNLVLKKDFEGVEANVSYSQPFAQGGGSITTGEFLMGVSSADGKGNITVYGGYQDRQPIFQGSRDFSAFALTSTA